MTSQGTARGRFTRAIQQPNLWAAETSLRELGSVSLEDALSYLDLLAEQKPEELEQGAVRWHGRLETEATFLSMAESQLATAALASLCAGERDSIQVLRRLLRRVRADAGSVRHRLGHCKVGALKADLDVETWVESCSKPGRTVTFRREVD